MPNYNISNNGIGTLSDWLITSVLKIIFVRVCTEPGVNTTTVLKEASREMYKKYNFFDCTLQIEEFDSQMENCKQCQPPKSWLNGHPNHPRRASTFSSRDLCSLHVNTCVDNLYVSYQFSFLRIITRVVS